MYRQEPQLPPRPHVPAALWCLAGAWAAVHAVASHSFGAASEQLAKVAVAGGAAALVPALCLVALQRKGAHEVAQVLCALLVAAALGVCAAGWRYQVQARVRDALASSAVSSWRLRVASDATASEYGYRCRAQALVAGKQTGVVWLSSAERLERGSVLSCVGRLKPLSPDDYGRRSWEQGVCCSVTVVRVLHLTHEDGLRALLEVPRRRALAALKPGEGEGRALVAGCVCGNREALDACGLTDDFSSCGIAHLIAVSGAHIALVSLLVSKLMVRIRAGFPARIVALAAATGLFVLFCGAPPSAVRAWAMSVVAFGAQMRGRRTHGLSSVAVVALVLLLWDPTLAASLGYQLSVLSVVGLSLYASYVSYALTVLAPTPQMPRWVQGSRRRAITGALDATRASVGACLVCQAITLPVTARAFGKLSLVAPVTNLVFAPLMSPLMALGLGVCVLAQAGTAGLAAGVCDALAALPLRVVRALARLPWSCVTVTSFEAPLAIITVLALLAILIAWPRVSRHAVGMVGAACVLVLAGALVRWRVFASPRIVVLDIGQGDAILVQDGSAAVLVDTGPPDDAVVRALARQHVLHLDAVVLTHLHDDHYGGLEALGEAMGCDQVYVARGVAQAMPESIHQMCLAASGVPPGELAYGDTLHVGGYALRVVWPTVAVDGDENCESMELLARYEKSGQSLSALLTGDAERDETGACVASGDVGDIDLLKVGHHGSEVSLTPDEVAALTPEVSVASAGENNRYGHPAPACVEMLQAGGSVVLCTKDVGDVEVRPGATGPKVVTARPLPIAD